MKTPDERLAEHGVKIERLCSDVAKMDAKLDEVVAMLNRARGGWKVGMMAMGGAGLVGGIAAKILPMAWVALK